MLVTDQNSIELANEAIIREWDRLKLWLKEARDDLRLQKKISTDTADWVRTGRPGNYGGFYAGTLLIDAQTWAKHATPSQDEADFIAASTTADESRRAEEKATSRRVRNIRRASMVGSLVAVVALIFAIGATFVGIQANESANLAATQAADAELRQAQAGTAVADANTQLTAIPPTLTQISLLLVTSEAQVTVFAQEQNRILTQVAGRTPSVTSDINAPIPDGTEPPVSNSDWMPTVRVIDGVEMVLVPTGCFQMGSSDGNADESPVHEQCFSEPFWVDRTEVTWAEYQLCIAAGVCQVPVTSDTISVQTEPVNRVTWFQAETYCSWRGGRLPTEAEWEYAARGPESWVYPWGNQFNSNFVVYSSSSSGQAASVGSRPQGTSWVGALDMSGNVSEWTSSIYRNYPFDSTDGRESNSNSDNRVIRGGSWLSSPSSVRSASRAHSFPPASNVDIGFRCVRSDE